MSTLTYTFTGCMTDDDGRYVGCGRDKVELVDEDRDGGPNLVLLRPLFCLPSVLVCVSKILALDPSSFKHFVGAFLSASDPAERRIRIQTRIWLHSLLGYNVTNCLLNNHVTPF